MKTNRLNQAVKAAAILMTLILAAGSFTACKENTRGRETTVPETTDGTAGESGAVSETVIIKETQNPDDGNRRYATDYPIEVKELKKDFLDDWNIWKRQENGVTFLQISNSGFHGRETEMEYLSFWVFDSEEDAKAAYKKHYDRSKEYDNGRFWEEGDNWFLSEEPDVMDASIVWMNYREGNVIIYSHLGSVSTFGKEKDSDTPSDPDKLDTSTLMDYVLGNSTDIRSYVIDVIMEA